jgi:hypothetical protein
MTEASVSFAGSLTDDPEPLRTVGIHRQPIAAEFHKPRRPGSIKLTTGAVIVCGLSGG